MAQPRGPVKGASKYTLRFYDSFDNYWFDIKRDISYQEARSLWLRETQGGKLYTEYRDGAYYDIFPADTRMVYDKPMSEYDDI